MSDVKFRDALKRYAAPNESYGDESGPYVDAAIIADYLTCSEPVTEEALRAMECIFENRKEPLVNGWIVPGTTDPVIRLVPDGEKYIVEAKSQPKSHWHDSVGLCDVRTMGELRCGLLFLGITTPGEKR